MFFIIMGSVAERFIDVMVDLLKGYPTCLPTHPTQLTYFFLDTPSHEVIVINCRCHLRVRPHEVIRLVSS